MAPPGGFVPPSIRARKTAIGSLAGLPAPFRRAFTESPSFKPIPSPAPGDWLWHRAGAGQSYDQWHDRGRRRESNVIGVVPVGNWPAEHEWLLEKLRTYLDAFFLGWRVKLLPTLELPPSIRSRELDGSMQLHTTDLIRLLKSIKKREIRCLAGVLMTDLYPADDWYFVFGKASLAAGVGVFSFARYKDDGPATLLRRSVKVASHEICHMLWIKHCVFFDCRMCGSNSLEVHHSSTQALHPTLQQSDASPMFLCPVCLRKLHSAVGFDVASRYGALLRWMEGHEGFEAEAEWLHTRIGEVGEDGR